MNEMFSDKINLLKALAIMLVVSGHLEFSLLGMFPPYSFQLALFFFISGYLFNPKYLDDIQTFLQKRVKSLLVPYFLYNILFLGITVFIAKISGKFWGMPISLKNFFLTPFLNGHQFDLSCPLWFVTQLFMTLVVFLFLMRVLRGIKDNKFFHLAVFAIIGIVSIPLSKVITMDPLGLVLIRTMFSLLFVYVGFYYRQFIEGKYDIFRAKWLFAIIILQSVLWLFNRDFTPSQGIGLSYVLVWARFDQQLIVPIITSFTGIWASLFMVNIFYPYIKNIKFFQQMGNVTYHIMALHLLVMYSITTILMYINGAPQAERFSHDIYWIYDPVQTTFLYFVITMGVTTYAGVGLKAMNKKLQALFNNKKD